LLNGETYQFLAIEDTGQFANRGIESSKSNCRERLSCGDVKTRKVSIECHKNHAWYHVEDKRIELVSTTFVINCQDDHHCQNVVPGKWQMKEEFCKSRHFPHCCLLLHRMLEVSRVVIPHLLSKSDKMGLPVDRKQEQKHWERAHPIKK
jgi:hypothetical protein